MPQFAKAAFKTHSNTTKGRKQKEDEKTPLQRKCNFSNFIGLHNIVLNCPALDVSYYISFSTSRSSCWRKCRSLQAFYTSGVPRGWHFLAVEQSSNIVCNCQCLLHITPLSIQLPRPDAHAVIRTFPNIRTSVCPYMVYVCK